MNKKTFIVATVMFVISLIACVFGHYFMLSILKSIAENSVAGLGLVFVMPIALIAYGVQALFTIICIPLFAVVIKREKSSPISRASIVMIVISTIALVSVLLELIVL